MSSKQPAQGISRRKQKGRGGSGSSLSKKRSQPALSISTRQERYPVVQNKWRMSKYDTAVINQILCPGNSGSATVVAPSRGTQSVCSRHIHKEVDIDSVAYPNGFAVVMRPDIHSPSYITSQGAGNFPTAQSTMSMNGTIQYSPGSNFVGGSFDAKNEVDGHALISPQVITIGATDYYGFNGVFDHYLHIAVRNVGETESTPSITFYDYDGVNLNMLTDFKSVGEGSEKTWTGGFSGPVTSLVWAVSNPNNILHFSLQFDMGHAQIATATTDTFNKAFPKVETDLAVTCGRVLSMSVLLTNTTPLLEKGGNINVARVPHTFNIFGPNVVSKLSDLPDNRRYQSTAAEGGYAWWVATEIDAFEIDGVANKTRQYRESEFIYASVLGWPAGSSFKLHFDWVIEFYTPNQLFEKSPPPPLTPKFERILYVLSRVPAATCNPEHGKLFQKLISTGNSIYGMAKGAYDHFEKYGPVYTAALEALATLL